MSDWWRDGVFYQVYPRSFADSDGDGVGDLRGVTGKLDYLEWLGIDGIWLNPVHPSPNVDWGYDVADYYGVHPELGTLDDLDELVAEAGRRGIGILLDLVPNHTSSAHAWFRERPDFYIWQDEIPNNWLAAFGGGSAWTWDEERGAYYLHNFAKEQPDLDWWNEEVRDEFDRILRFWFDRGIAGFRIDVAHAIVKDRELRDDIPATEEDAPHIQRIGLRHVHSMNRPEVHDVHRRWRRIADEYEPPRILVGETYVLDPVQMAGYYGSGTDELDLAFNFALVHADLDADRMRAIVEATEAALPAGAWPVWTASNHDALRFTTRWCEGDQACARAVLLILLGLRGTPFLYYGDELALANGEVPPERILDVGDPPRDPGRTPMPWTRDGGWENPWLPLTDTSRNVEDQGADPASTLSFTRELIRLRREFTREPYESLPAPHGVWSWRRGDYRIAVNLGDEEQAVDLPGEALLATGGATPQLLPPRSGVVTR
jgi:alpha-glucosidase